MKKSQQFVKFFKKYRKIVEERAKFVYENAVYKPNSKEEKVFMEKVAQIFAKAYKTLEKNEEHFYKIVDTIGSFEGASVVDLNKVKLYLPLVIESEVCHALLPYTQNSQYIKNDEHYKLKFSALKTKLKIELDYTAKDKEKSTYEKRIEAPERSYSSGRSYYVDSSSSYGSSFGEKVRSEVAGTAMFLRGFLPW